MNTEVREIVVGGLPVRVERKAIKNLHLGVYPPNGRVRVAVPLAVSDAAVRQAVIGKLGWIKRQRARFAGQVRQSPRELVSGESHYFLGRRYRLRLVESDGPAKIILRSRTWIELRARAGMSVAQRDRALQRWYRQQLLGLLAPLLARWQKPLGVELTHCGIKKMKTRWGTCNSEARRIWVNLELAKKPIQCLEYIVVHELVHLLVRRHGDRFVALMNQHLPHWRTSRAILNAEPLAHEDWIY